MVHQLPVVQSKPPLLPRVDKLWARLPQPPLHGEVLGQVTGELGLVRPGKRDEQPVQLGATYVEVPPDDLLGVVVVDVEVPRDAVRLEIGDLERVTVPGRLVSTEHDVHLGQADAALWRLVLENMSKKKKILEMPGTMDTKMTHFQASYDSFDLCITKVILTSSSEKQLNIILIDFI